MLRKVDLINSFTTRGFNINKLSGGNYQCLETHHLLLIRQKVKDPFHDNMQYGQCYVGHLNFPGYILGSLAFKITSAWCGLDEEIVKCKYKDSSVNNIEIVQKCVLKKKHIITIFVQLLVSVGKVFFDDIHRPLVLKSHHTV